MGWGRRWQGWRSSRDGPQDAPVPAPASSEGVGRRRQRFGGGCLGQSCCPRQSRGGDINPVMQSTARAAPSAHCPAGGDGDLLAWPLQTPAPLPAPAAMAAGRARAEPAAVAGVMAEPRLSQEAPGESKRREEPE